MVSFHFFTPSEEGVGLGLRMNMHGMCLCENWSECGNGKRMAQQAWAVGVCGWYAHWGENREARGARKRQTQ